MIDHHTYTPPPLRLKSPSRVESSSLTIISVIDKDYNLTQVWRGPRGHAGRSDGVRALPASGPCLCPGPSDPGLLLSYFGLSPLPPTRQWSGLFSGDRYSHQTWRKSKDLPPLTNFLAVEGKVLLPYCDIFPRGARLTTCSPADFKVVLLPHPPLPRLDAVQGCMPPAQNLALVVNLRKNTQFLAPRLAKLLLRLYFVAIVPVTLWVSVFVSRVPVPLAAL